MEHFAHQVACDIQPLGFLFVSIVPASQSCLLSGQHVKPSIVRQLHGLPVTKALTGHDSLLISTKRFLHYGRHSRNNVLITLVRVAFQDVRWGTVSK